MQIKLHYCTYTSSNLLNVVISVTENNRTAVIKSSVLSKFQLRNVRGNRIRIQECTIQRHRQHCV